MKVVCPNCGGELVRRPRREERASAGALTRRVLGSAGCQPAVADSLPATLCNRDVEIRMICPVRQVAETNRLAAHSAPAANELQAFCGANGVRVMPISGTRQMPSTPNAQRPTLNAQCLNGTTPI